MRVLVAGAHGQLGRALVRRAGEHEVIALGRDALDLEHLTASTRALAHHAPELVIDAAAYTDVDRAETECERAFASNALGAARLAAACAARDIPMMYVSTDHVFDGAASRPYREDDATAPVNVYGETKALGEVSVRRAGGIVVRTSWLFASPAARGFVQAIIRQALAQPSVQVVDDEHGCPTWADDLADALLALSARAERGAIYHYCGDGPVSRHAFATAIVDELRATGRPVACGPVEATSSEKLRTAARRPARAILDTTRIRALGIVPRPWRAGLARVVAAELGAS